MTLDESLRASDKMEVLLRATMKALRGIVRRLFLGECHGLLFIGRKVSISHASHVRCGRNCKFEDYSEIHGLCSDGLNFGDNVTIGRGVMIRPSSYYGIDLGSGLTMGSNSSIGPHGYIGCSGPIFIGENVMIGPKCSLFAENHVFTDSAVSIKSQGVVQKGVTIEDNCWIGSNVIILDGVTIGHDSVIGAGTLVTKNVEPYSIVVDRRAKNVRLRGEESTGC